ncbi:hypothetical protein BDV96DRAFT_118999 [Lophiotrema nucula]|uniref:Zn(2)-C6 fungal-type domain-containing protein n=1 Tax=Lophiotrema nucula TaxID=690887 RepID=A0A6A5Z3A1_9PLEO|nr:hypothetical protein BDV96DRAFT_118999 [Lophiotrema nucula]
MDRDDWRLINACTRCHQHKVRCRRPLDQLTCLRCSKFGIACVPRPPKRNIGTSSASHQSRVSPPQTTLENATNLHDVALSTSMTPTLPLVSPSSGDEDFASVAFSMDDTLQSLSDQMFANNGIGMNSDVDSMGPWFDLEPLDSHPHTSLPMSGLDLEGMDGFLSHDSSQPVDSTLQASKSTSAANSPLCTTWLEELTNINARLFAQITVSTQDEFSEHVSQPTANGDRTRERPKRNLWDERRVDECFELATQLSTIVDRRPAQLGGPSAAKSASTLSHSEFADNTESQHSLELAENLRNHSVVLLLVTSYLCLLSVFTTFLASLEVNMQGNSSPGPSDVENNTSGDTCNASLSLPLLHLNTQSVGRSFTAVNMIELFVRRIGLTLNLSTESKEHSSPEEAADSTIDPLLADPLRTSEKDRDIDNYGTAIKILSPLLVEQQEALLGIVDRIRKRFLTAREL